MATRPRRTIVCDVGAIVDPDLGTIDTLARLTLEVRRQGYEIRLRRAGTELEELVAFAGLDEILGLEPRRQAEEREELLRVEEERELDDPPV